MIRSFTLALTLAILPATTTPSKAASVTFYDTAATWTSAIAAQPQLSLSGPVTMDGGINTGAVIQSLTLPSDDTTVTVSRGAADSPDDLGYQFVSIPTLSPDGTSWSMVSGQWILSMRLSAENQASVPDFARSPQGYRIAFAAPVLGFGFNFARTGSTNAGGTDGTFIGVGDQERSVTFHSYQRAGFGYLGVLSDTPLDSFELFFRGTGDYAYMYFDNLTVARQPEASVVPLPPSALFLVAGLAALALKRGVRRRTA